MAEFILSESGSKSPLWSDPLCITEKEQKALARSFTRGTPFGTEQWTAQIVKRNGLQSTVRQRGRPKKIG